MRKVIEITFVLLSITICSQKKFEVKFEADYKLHYKLTNTENSYAYETTFALLIGNNSSYFKSMNKYMADSLILARQMKNTGNMEKDLSNYYNRYYTDFPENIGTTSKTIYFTTEIEGKAFEYEESNDINWKVKNEFKNVLGFECQKAETTKYGRVWTAWFTTEIPFQYGPYKFNGLPGLITELYDSKNEYHYTLYAFRKRKYTCSSANIYKDAKKVQKEKIYNYQKNKYQNIDRLSKYIQDKSQLEELRQSAVNMAKKHNPIELSIE
ncbi:GLPGLI family protein [Chryseobacterium sp.]|uniref:GLPGLI family protein n=1 Tax=Chryseobacterium sp. TaxID=1871047 RepID=UPI000EBEED92|nr:GLPGLI family protein [Chryseobacterium sp.]HCA09847.1 hypothetical protein [Chryseobacterium sp.]